MTGAPVGDGLVIVGVRQPGLAGQPDVARVELVADVVDRQGALADEPAVDARASSGGSPWRRSRRLRNGRTRTTPSIATTMATTAWIQTALSGTTKARTPAAKAPTARKIEKNVVLASSSTSSASAATNQITIWLHDVSLGVPRDRRRPSRRSGRTSVARRVIDSSS